MHMKLIFCIVLLQLLLTVYAGEGDDKGKGDAKPGEKPKGDTTDGGKGHMSAAQEVALENNKEKKGKSRKAGGRLSRGLNGAAERAVAIEMTRGWCRYLPRSTKEAFWIVYPKSTCERCNMQGVIKLTQPYWANILTVTLVFERPRKYSFNLGDSPNNNAWGGDDDYYYKYDAEIHSYFSKLYLWRNQYACNSLLYCHYTAVKTALLIRIYRYGVYITNYEGVNVWRCSNRFFRMTGGECVYLGLNRVIQSVKAYPYYCYPRDYTGSGLCSAYAFWSR